MAVHSDAMMNSKVLAACFIVVSCATSADCFSIDFHLAQERLPPSSQLSPARFSTKTKAGREASIASMVASSQALDSGLSPEMATPLDNEKENDALQELDITVSISELLSRAEAMAKAAASMRASLNKASGMHASTLEVKRGSVTLQHLHPDSPLREFVGDVHLAKANIRMAMRTILRAPSSKAVDSTAAPVVPELVHAGATAEAVATLANNEPVPDIIGKVAVMENNREISTVNPGAMVVQIDVNESWVAKVTRMKEIISSGLRSEGGKLAYAPKMLSAASEVESGDSSVNNKFARVAQIARTASVSLENWNTKNTQLRKHASAEDSRLRHSQSLAAERKLVVRSVPQRKIDKVLVEV